MDETQYITPERRAEVAQNKNFMDPLTPSAKSLLQHATQFAKSLNHSYVDSGHILVAALQTDYGTALHVRKSLRLKSTIGARAQKNYERMHGWTKKNT